MTATACARTVVACLLELGVEHVVLCPGSRSAPLAFAWEAAARAGRVELHVRIDERSAGFLALGLAKASRTVVPIVTTSGTAVGNLLPAVMEASHSGIPLLVLSADRPATMLHTGANQTTDQAQLFGRFVRADAQISGGEGSPRAWSYQVARLVTAALGSRTRDPGPVQLNIAFAEPLTPTDEVWPDVTPTIVPPSAPREPDDLGDLGGAGEEEPEGPPELAPATVVLVGDCRPEVGARAAAFAERKGLPLLAEPSGNARRGSAIRSYRLLLGADLGREIRRVLLFGHPTLSRPVTRLLSREDVEVVAVTDGARWVDPGLTVRAVVDQADSAPGDPEWLARWQAADADVSARVDELLAGELSGHAVAAAVWHAAADQALVIGSSNPIRDLDLAPVGERAPVAYANRGLAGIDGTIATATGVALVQGSTTLLLGDLTFLHDAGSLLIGPLERRPELRIVVVNDDGGSIFHLLEQGADEHATPFERVFGTPTGVTFEPLASAYGWAYREVTSLADLHAALAEPITGPGIVEVRVRRDDRRSTAERLGALTNS